jgi:hypothetical protein
LGFNGYPRLVVYAKGFAGNFEVTADSGASIVIDGDLFDVTSSTSTSKIGYAGYKDTVCPHSTPLVIYRYLSSSNLIY